MITDRHILEPECIQAPPGPAYELDATVAARLSSGSSKRGRLQRAALALLLEHEEAGMLPTNGRFLFYEAEQRGIVSKTRPGERGRRGDQDLIDALKWLRDNAIVPWGWLVDETRTLDEWGCADSVADYLIAAVDQARISPWNGERPPLILCESRSLRGVLRAVAEEYLCPIAATNGQAGGFLHTDLAPILAGNNRRVLYLGDHDLSGDQIEANTRFVLERAAGRGIRWERLAITDEQVEERQLKPIVKRDSRYTPPRVHEAWETEALGQETVVRLVRDGLDELLPESLPVVRERERREREELLRRLEEITRK